MIGLLILAGELVRGGRERVRDSGTQSPPHVTDALHRKTDRGPVRGFREPARERNR